MKIKIRFEDLQGIGDTIMDIQSASCECLISLLISMPEIFEKFESANKDKSVVETILSTIEFQNTDSFVVECGLRFIALYAKHDPQLLQKLLIEKKSGESLLNLVESAVDPEIIANGLAIVATCFPSMELTNDENDRILTMILLHHIKSPSLRVICECINAIFDLYSDEKYDSVLATHGVVDMLEGSLGKLKDKIQTDKHEYDEGEIEYFEELLQNLEQFLKYKRENM
jgi:hypothetical protein